MSKSYFEGVLSPQDFRLDAALPTLKKSPSRVDVVLFCAAIRNFHRLHYDETYTKAQGIKDILVPGFMTGNWCIEAATRACGQGARVRKLRFQNTRMAFVGQEFDVGGRVIGLDLDGDGNQLVTCELAVQNDTGEVVTKATVQISFPTPI